MYFCTHKTLTIMKRLLLTLAMIVCAAQVLVAQDVIVTRQAARIDAKILEVSETEVKYKKTSNPDGPVFILSTDNIASILYANGEVQVFEQQQPKSAGENPQKSVSDRKFEDGVVLFREGRYIVDNRAGSIYEPENLKDLLGKDAYGNYLDAQGSYGRGTAMITIGWLGTIMGVICILAGNEEKKADLVLSGWIVGGVCEIFLPIGYTVRGIAAGRISRIAEAYNADAYRQLGMDMTVVPSMLLAYDGTVAPGVGFSLRF